MAYPSVDEFKEILLRIPLQEVVKTYIFQGTPYVFRNSPRLSRVLRDHLCSQLDLSEQNIIVVGSAKIGFSLSPDNFPRRFSDHSDIDILVVDQDLFDKVWETMIKWNYPKRFRLEGADWNWAKKRREELFWGWFAPDKIRFEGLSLPEVLKPLRDISTSWFNAFRSLGQYNEFAARDVSGRLYRSWRHALLYQSEGLRLIKEAMNAP